MYVRLYDTKYVVYCMGYTRVQPKELIMQNEVNAVGISKGPDTERK